MRGRMEIRSGSGSGANVNMVLLLFLFLAISPIPGRDLYVIMKNR